MTARRWTLVVVDDDAHIRRAVGRLLRSHGHVVHAFDSAEAYLARPGHADCAIVDIKLPGLSGLELYEHLNRQGSRLPFVFITAHDDLNILEAVQRTRSPFLRKPLDEHVLLDAIARAIGDRSDSRPR